jgi:hypothetical protein
MEILSPTLPTTLITWFHIVALALVGSVKLFRGIVMQRRARVIDFFGWSIIMFDYVFGTALIIGTLWSFYPGAHHRWFDLMTTGALVIVAIWQGYTIFTASENRLDRALVSTQELTLGEMEPGWENGNNIEERRKGPRRESDKQMLAKIEKLESQQ